jgi:integrase
MTDISKVWSRIRNKAGIPDVRLHDLRHSYASFLANSGCNEFQIQEALGHASTVTTRRYVHMSKESMQKAAGAASDRINAALKANS